MFSLIVTERRLDLENNRNRSHCTWLALCNWPGKPDMSEATARIQITTQKGIQVVEFKESRILDELNINEIGQTLAGLVKTLERPKLLLDFSNVDHLSSAALGMLINVNNSLKERNGQLRLCTIRPAIMEVFSITRLDRMFKIVATRADALASFA
jgi:anti-sigma B factor antagonist